MHCTLARVPTVRQNTADDNDNDTLRNGHRADVRRPMLHGTGSVKADNACPSDKNWRLLNGKSTTRIQKRDIHVTDHGRRAELQRAETEEVELHTSVLTGGRSRALDNEKLTFSCMFKIQKNKYSIK